MKICYSEEFYLYFVHLGYAKAMDKDGRPLASAFYSGQVGFHDTLFVSTAVFTATVPLFCLISRDGKV